MTIFSVFRYLRGCILTITCVNERYFLDAYGIKPGMTGGMHNNIAEPGLVLEAETDHQGLIVVREAVGAGKDELAEEGDP